MAVKEEWLHRVRIDLAELDLKIARLDTGTAIRFTG